VVIGWEEGGTSSVALAAEPTSIVSSLGGLPLVSERFSGSWGGEDVTSACDPDEVRLAPLSLYVDREVENASSKASFKM
jgi:hypothetical protein